METRCECGAIQDQHYDGSLCPVGNGLFSANRRFHPEKFDDDPPQTATGARLLQRDPERDAIRYAEEFLRAQGITNRITVEGNDLRWLMVRFSAAMWERCESFRKIAEDMTRLNVQPGGVILCDADRIDIEALTDLGIPGVFVGIPRGMSVNDAAVSLLEPPTEEEIFAFRADLMNQDGGKTVESHTRYALEKCLERRRAKVVEHGVKLK